MKFRRKKLAVKPWQVTWKHPRSICPFLCVELDCCTLFSLPVFFLRISHIHADTSECECSFTEPSMPVLQVTSIPMSFNKIRTCSASPAARNPGRKKSGCRHYSIAPSYTVILKRQQGCGLRQQIRTWKLSNLWKQSNICTPWNIFCGFSLLRSLYSLSWENEQIQRLE